MGKVDLTGTTALITGGTRGIGRAMALTFARHGAQIAVLGRGASGSAVADEINAAGGKAVFIVCDIGDEAQVKKAIEKTVHEFGGLDIVVNNASTLVLKSTPDINMDEYDAMAQINTRGCFSVAKHALDHLQKSSNGHILTLCPKPQLDEKWFVGRTAYAVSKFSTGLIAFGLAAEQRSFGVASNTLWPFTTIDTDGLAECGNSEFQARPRSPSIMADAALHIVSKNSREFTGNFCLDEVVLRENGISDFSPYSAVPNTPLTELSRDHMVSPEQLARLTELRLAAGDPAP